MLALTHLFMRIANTIKITAHSPSQEEQIQLLEALKTLTKVPAETQSLTHPEFPTLHNTKLWLTRQPDVRAVLRFLSHMPQTDKNQLLSQVSERIDSRGNFFFRIDKQAFIEGKPLLKDKENVLQIRINVAAHPKNEQTIAHTVRTFLTEKDINL